MSESTLNQILVCHKCGEVITSSIEMLIDGNHYCTGCYSDEISSVKLIENISDINYSSEPYKNKYSTALGMIAIIELLSSIMASIFIWIEYGTVELSMGNYYTYSEKVVNPIGIGLGFGVLFQGIVFFILLSALKIIADDIAEVKNNNINKKLGGI